MRVVAVGVAMLVVAVSGWCTEHSKIDDIELLTAAMSHDDLAEAIRALLVYSVVMNETVAFFVVDKLKTDKQIMQFGEMLAGNIEDRGDSQKLNEIGDLFLELLTENLLKTLEKVKDMEP